MLNKDILELRKQLREDCPDFYALEGLSPSLATQICLWIKEDRLYTINKYLRNERRRDKRRNKR